MAAAPVLFSVQLFNGLRDLKDDSSEFCGWDRTGTKVYFNTCRTSFLEYMQETWLPAVFPNRKFNFATFKTYLSKLGFQAEVVDRTVYRFHSKFVRDSTEEAIRAHFPSNPDTKPKAAPAAPLVNAAPASSESDDDEAAAASETVVLKRRLNALEGQYAQVQKRLTSVEHVAAKLVSHLKTVGRNSINMHDYQLNIHQQYLQFLRESRGTYVQAVEGLEASDDEEDEE